MYRLILESTQLHSFHKTVDNELSVAIAGADFCIRNGLTNQCRKIISKAKGKAIKAEKFIKLLEILDIEQRLLSGQNYEIANLHEVNDLFGEVKSTLAQIQNYESYRLIRAQFYVMMKGGQTGRDKKSNLQLKRFFQNDFLRNEEKATSTYSRVMLFQTLSMYYRLLHDNTTSYTYTLRALQAFDDNPVLTRFDPFKYANLLSSCIRSASIINNTKDAETLAIRLNMFTKKHIPDKVATLKTESLVLDIQLNKCLLFWDKKDLDKTEHLAATAEKIALKLSVQTNFVIMYNLAYLYFGQKKYKQSLKYLKRIFYKANRHDQQSEIYCFSRLLYLLALYEMGDDDHLQHQIKSTSRFLAVRRRTYEFEGALLQFLRTEPGSGNNVKHMESFRQFRNIIASFQSNHLEKTIFDYFDWISWIDSKLLNKPFMEVARENVRSE